MTKIRKRKIKRILWSIGFFTIGVYLYSMAKFWKEGYPLQEFTQDLFVAITGGILGGGLLGVYHEFLSKDLRTRKPFGILILLETFVDILIIILVFIPVTTLGTFFFTEMNLGEAFQYNLDYLFTLSFLALLLFLLALAVLYNFLRQISKKIGPDVMWGLLTGKYYHPREESHVVMFLDMKNSTLHAERLGHLTYSRFLQDCFFDLNHLALAHEASIYKYVGDEAILTWGLEDGIQDANCIHVFYAFQAKLDSRKNYYLAEYGFMPQFKAGINSGRITVAEVGDHRREIEYHGDVLNTAARIQGKCNALGKGLLVSKNIADLLSDKHPYDFEAMGDIELKGKEQKVQIFSVSPQGVASPQ